MLTLFFKKNFDFFFLSHSRFPSHNHSSLHVAPIHFSFLFSYGSNAKPSLFIKKKKKKNQSWNDNVEMWLKSPEDVKDIQIKKLPWNTYGFFYQKKKKKAPQTRNVKSL